MLAKKLNKKNVFNPSLLLTNGASDLPMGMGKKIHANIFCLGKSVPIQPQFFAPSREIVRAMSIESQK